jgi:uncharacterized protein DUF4175
MDKPTKAGSALPENAIPHLDRLRLRIRSMRRWARCVEWLRLPAGSASEGLLLLAVILTIEYLVVPAPLWRTALCVLALIAWLYRLQARLRVACRAADSPLCSAQKLDRKYPKLQDRATACLSLAEERKDIIDGFSPPLLIRLYREGDKAIKHISRLTLAPTGWLLGECSAIALLVLLAVLLPNFTACTFSDIWGQFSSRLLTPSQQNQIFLSVSPEGLRYRSGQPVVIKAAVVGKTTEIPNLIFRSGEVEWESQPMNGVDGHFNTTLSDLSGRYEYYVEVADTRSPIYSADPIVKLALSNLEISVSPPEYVSAPAKPAAVETGEIAVTNGGSINWTAVFDRPVKRTLLLFTPDVKASTEPSQEAVTPPKPMRYGWTPGDNDKTWSLQLQPNNSGYAEIIAHASQDGVEGYSRKWKVSMHPDALPVIKLLSPGKDILYPKDGQLTLRYQASDDFGLKKIWLSHRIGDGQEEKTTVHSFSQGESERTGVFIWPLPWPPPSEPIYYSLRASDYHPLESRGVRSGSSPIYMIGENRPQSSHVRQSVKSIDELRNELNRLLATSEDINKRLNSRTAEPPPPEEAARLEQGIKKLREEMNKTADSQEKKSNGDKNKQNEQKGDNPDSRKQDKGKKQGGESPDLRQISDKLGDQQQSDNQTGEQPGGGASDQAKRLREGLEEGNNAAARSASRRLTQQLRKAKTDMRERGKPGNTPGGGKVPRGHLLAKIETKETPKIPDQGGKGEAPGEKQANNPVGKGKKKQPSDQNKPISGNANSGAPADAKPDKDATGQAKEIDPKLGSSHAHQSRTQTGNGKLENKLFEEDKYPDKYKEAVSRFRSKQRESR